MRRGERGDVTERYRLTITTLLTSIPLSTTPEGLKLLEDADMIPELPKEPRVAETRDLPEMLLNLPRICDPTTAFLSIAFISSVLTTCQIDDTETEIPNSILSDIGDKYPEVITLA